jgi:hypothetical protein
LIGGARRTLEQVPNDTSKPNNISNIAPNQRVANNNLFSFKSSEYSLFYWKWNLSLF